MHNDYSLRPAKCDYIRHHYSENSSVYGSLSSAERIGAERGYAQGIEDERRRSREKIAKIIRKLKLRGYSIEHIAEDTGIPIEDVASL
jgi:predicted transposase YdaD